MVRAMGDFPRVMFRWFIFGNKWPLECRCGFCGDSGIYWFDEKPPEHCRILVECDLCGINTSGTVVTAWEELGDRMIFAAIKHIANYSLDY